MKNILKHNTIFFNIGTLLFFLMIVFPFNFVSLKIILIILILGYSIFFLRDTSKFVFIWFFLYLLWGFSFLLFGFYHNNMGVTSLLGVFIIWPIVYFIFISNINNIESLYKLINILLFSSVFMSLYIILYVLSIKTGIIDPSFFSMASQVIDPNLSKIDIFVPFGTSLLFIIPFNIALLLNIEQKIFNKKYLFVALIFNLVSAFFINRNALNLIIVVSPFIMIFLIRIIDRRLSALAINKKFFIVFVIGIFFVLGLVIVFNEQIRAVLDNLILGFQFTTENTGANLRYEQFFQLLNAWQEVPILGKGLGATIDNFTRSDTSPWAFELSYLALLYNVGVIGMAMFIGFILALIQKSIIVARISKPYSPIIVATLVGTISFLIANATNPYLYAYDHMWALFAPLAIINVYYITQKRSNAR